MKQFAAGGGIAATLGAIGYKIFHQDNDKPMGTLDATDYAYFAYVTEYGKSYGTVGEFMFRSNEFRKSMEYIEEHNRDPTLTWTVGIN